jgi:peptide/nickel transport system permease protein
MLKYVLKRILMLIPVILGIVFLVFFIMDLAPGDPVYQIVSENATDEEIAAVRAEYGLDKPLLVRYGNYVVNMVRGDLGRSYITQQDVLSLYMEKFPATLMLALAAIFVAVVISLPLGIYASVKQNTWQDGVCMIFSLLGLSIPNFWLGLLLIILFALTLGWLPASGMRSFSSIILPAITEGTGLAAFITRTTRSSMLETIRADYVTTARAKGVSRKDSVLKHAFRNALIPIITASGMQFAYVMAGCVLTETVFAWPGVGRQLVAAINDRDIPTVTGFLVLTAIVTCLINLIMDIVYAYVDPRVKVQYAAQNARKRKKAEVGK